MAVMSYEVRPSKTVTRRIFVDLLRRLAPVAPFDQYQYVGFGALEFIDFDLIHRHLGIERMTSIEQNEAQIARYEHNRPFNGITVLSGRASTHLASIDWTGLSIVWLDYTDTATDEVIRDVESLARMLSPGSILAVSVNAHPARENERVQALERAVTAERVPIGMNEAKLGGWGLARVQREILVAAINETCGDRLDGARWQQLLNINYQDSARMQFLAGIVSTPVVDRLIEQCHFDDAPDVRRGDNPLEVRVPLLTSRERHEVNALLPNLGGGPLSVPGLPQRDLDAYAEVYRWLETAR